MRSTFALLTLLLIAALGLVSPSGCAACRVDLHGGQGLHVVFDHPHPAAPVETDGLAADSGPQSAFHAAHASAGGEPVLVGQVMPLSHALAELERPGDRLVASQDSRPVGFSIQPLDPPPRAA